MQQPVQNESLHFEKSKQNRSFTDSIISWLDRYVPQENVETFEGANRVRKARLIVALSIFSSLACFLAPIFMIIFSVSSSWAFAISTIVGVSMMCNAPLLKKTGNFRLVGSFFLIQTGIMIIGSSSQLGGMLAVSAIFLLIWPLENTFLLSPKAGVISGIITSIVLILFFVFQEQIDRINLIYGNDEVYYLVYLFCFIIGIITILAIGWTYESFQSRAIVQMETMVDELKAVNRELTNSKEAAEAATKAKSEFLANMSHEIRTPLNGVLGMANITLDTDLTAEQREFIETIRNSGDSLLTIINDILDFSKIEAGRIDLEEQPFNLRRCVEDALDLLSSNAEEKGLELLYSIPLDMHTEVIGDVTRLRQILINLIGNAIKFTGEGEVLVEVSAQQQENDQIEYHFLVQDTGIGIPANRLDRLFKSFSQVDASTTRKFGGTGLGLAISKQLSELMGGTMWVESEPNIGSRFQFSVIFSKTELEEKSVIDTISPAVLIDKSILIVDDNQTNRHIIQKHVASWGMLPKVAASGPEALEILQDNRDVDLILIDFNMPHMNGSNLAQAIQKREESKSIPIVMMTPLGGHTLLDKEKKAVNSSFSSVTKPVKPSHLLVTFINLLSNKKKAVINRKGRSRFMTEGQSLADQLPLRILIAEDNLVNQKVTQKMLEKLGYRPDIVSDGIEAVESVKRQPYDLILMDLQMPQMDGLEATHTIRNELTLTDQPIIIAMTANTMDGDRSYYVEVGFNDYISKPVRLPVLQAALEKIGQPN